jgi:hypothetical protein
MSIKLAIPLLLLPLVSASALAQQTGTLVGRTPGSAINGGFHVIREVPPPTTCASAAGVPASANNAPALPDFVFERMDLLCVRHSDGRFEQLPKDLAGFWSPDGHELAYWNKEKHELHLRSIANGSDTIVDSLPDFIARGLYWSGKGRALVYLANTTNPIRYRVLDLDSGKRSIVEPGLTRILGAPDPAHLLAVGQNGVERISVSDGKHELFAAVKYVDDASYSQSGALLGMRVQNLDEGQAADDDTPDCTGGAFALHVLKMATKQRFEIPFPTGFNTVHDYAFSPDDRAIAVTFGINGCDYPGEAARVYLVSLPDLVLTPISPADRMSVQPHWSPDGKVIIYSDYSGTPPPLIAFDVRTGKATTITNPAQYDGPDGFISWRQP